MAISNAGRVLDAVLIGACALYTLIMTLRQHIDIA